VGVWVLAEWAVQFVQGDDPLELEQELEESVGSSIHRFITLLISIKVIAIEIILFLVIIKLLFALNFFDRKLHSLNTIEMHLDPNCISTPCFILIEFGSPPPSTWLTTFFLQSSGFRLGASIGFLECAVAPDDRKMLVVEWPFLSLWSWSSRSIRWTR
jgi:hypothetical protein